MTTDDAAARIGELVDKAWLLAAAARVMFRDGAGEPDDLLTEAARRVVDAAHLTLPRDDAALMLARGARSRLALALALADPTAAVRWVELDDETLLAQGRASGTVIGSMLAPDGPAPAGLRNCLAGPNAVFLDVGTGVGAICAALCRSWPELRCVGVDNASQPLMLAERELERAEVRDRVELRQQDVADLDDTEVFDVAWLPLPLMSGDAARPALANVVRALRPGGWIVVGVHGEPADEMQEALTALRSAAVGGSTAYHGDVMRWLTEAGVAEVVDVQSPVGGSSFLAGMRPV